MLFGGGTNPSGGWVQGDRAAGRTADARPSDPRYLQSRQHHQRNRFLAPTIGVARVRRCGPDHGYSVYRPLLAARVGAARLHRQGLVWSVGVRHCLRRCAGIQHGKGTMSSRRICSLGAAGNRICRRRTPGRRHFVHVHGLEQAGRSRWGAGRTFRTSAEQEPGRDLLLQRKLAHSGCLPDFERSRIYAGNNQPTPAVGTNCRHSPVLRSRSPRLSVPRCNVLPGCRSLGI